MAKKHPDKDIQAAIDYALSKGWIIVPAGGGQSHPFCRMKCSYGHKEHQHSVWSTPANAYHHARQIRRFVDRCEAFYGL